jgi:phosphatidylglycerophosphate synthase
MTSRAVIVGDGPVRLWALSSRERLTRQLRRAGVAQVTDRLPLPSEAGSVVLVRADHVYDDRVIAGLVTSPKIFLRADADPDAAIVAAHVPVALASAAAETLHGSARLSTVNARVVTPGTLAAAYQKQLRKAEPPFVERIVPAARRDLEDRLFAGSYKGVTDLITKWVWPRPARWVTRLCAAAGLHPNLVTAIGTGLAVAAGVLFSAGEYGWGLVLGWLMTFLDTVDGKLARVTISSSRFGHYLDHVTDLVHPPLWYLAWGLGLASLEPGLGGSALTATLTIIVAGYVVGRLVEGAFHVWLGEFSIFMWRRVDSCFRLVTARRNPNLVLLTAGALAGRPDLGLVAVAAWTAVTSAFLLVRFGMAAHARATTGPLRSWLADAGDRDGRTSLADRLFVTVAVER